MDSKKNTRVRTKKNIIANLTVSGMLLTSTVVVPASLLWAPTTVEAALVSAELFSDITQERVRLHLMQRLVQRTKSISRFLDQMQ